MVGMARCAVPARVVAGETNSRATLAFEGGVAPLHAARTSQRDVPTTLNTYPCAAGRGPGRGAPLNRLSSTHRDAVFSLSWALPSPIRWERGLAWLVLKPHAKGAKDAK